MPYSESIKEIVNWVAVYAATLVLITFRDTEKGSLLARTLNQQEIQRQRHGGPILGKPKFNWDVQDRYVELLDFELEVTNILETTAYHIK